LSHYRQVTEPKLRNLHDKVQELEMVNQDLMDELHQLKNQATIYANQVQTYKK
jgi:prefoldin subunit 5